MLMQAQIAALNARIALAEAEVLRVRSIHEDGAKILTSGIMDSRKICPQPLKDSGRWRPWSERVLRWAHMQSVGLHAALTAAMMSRAGPISHGCGYESILFWA